METSLLSGLISARMGQIQMAAAAKMLRMNAESAQSAVKLIDAAQQNIEQLTKAATGVGAMVDISV